MCTFLKRFSAFVSALVLCFALSFPALAADTELSGQFTVNMLIGENWATSIYARGNAPVSNFAQPVSHNPFMAFSSVVMNLSNATEGVYGIYASFYIDCSISSSSRNSIVVSGTPTISDFEFRFQNSADSSVLVSKPTSFNTFGAVDFHRTIGVTLAGRATSSPGKPLRQMLFAAKHPGSTPGLCASVSRPDYFDADGNSFYPQFTNLRFVTTASNAELDALESMASEIANQSQILSQFYGDIVAVCNQIYQRLGDLQAAQEEANALFANVIKLLNTTNGKLEAINMAMSTYFELLINQLKQEGIDTRTAIDDAEARLELYLKPMIDYFNELEEQTGESASTLPQHKTDIDGFNNDGFGIEADGQTGLTAILPIFTAFTFILSVLGIFVGLGVLKIIIKKGLS